MKHAHPVEAMPAGGGGPVPNSGGVDAEPSGPIIDIDMEAFTADVDALRQKALGALSTADYIHLLRMRRWVRWTSVIGWMTSGLLPNPLSVLLMSTANFARWTAVAHHILHRGYDRIGGVPLRHTSKGFARGWRRFVDWFDVLEPAAWVHEHNFQHHYKLGEPHDPDQPELNMRFLRTSKLPLFVRYVVVAFGAITWKYLYFVTNTQNEIFHHRAGHRKPAGGRYSLFVSSLWSPFSSPGRFVWFRCWAPYWIWRFGLVPLPFLLLGKTPWLFCLINMLGVEVMANLQSFYVIVPNHAGDDLFRFEGPAKSRGEFYLRQILSSANYKNRRSPQRLLARLFELPNRASPLSGFAAVGAEADPTRGSSALPQARTALPPAIQRAAASKNSWTSWSDDAA